MKNKVTDVFVQIMVMDVTVVHIVITLEALKKIFKDLFKEK